MVLCVVIGCSKRSEHDKDVSFKKLIPGDIVLADRGFDIAESVGMMQAQLHIPDLQKASNSCQFWK